MKNGINESTADYDENIDAWESLQEEHTPDFGAEISHRSNVNESRPEENHDYDFDSVFDQWNLDQEEQKQLAHLLTPEQLKKLQIDLKAEMEAGRDT